MLFSVKWVTCRLPKSKRATYRLPKVVHRYNEAMCDNFAAGAEFVCKIIPELQFYHAFTLCEKEVIFP